MGAVVKAGLATYRDIVDWKYSEAELYHMHDILELMGWLEFKKQTG